MEREKNISVIIPTYNRELLLKRAIASVRSQTHRHFELIVVDDGSDDRTREMLAGYGDEIIYIRQENRGPAAARNAGILAARHDLLAFLDADDCFDERKLELQVAAMNREPACLISYTGEIWYRRGRLLNQKKKHRPAAGDIFARCLEMCVVGMSTVMLRRRLFEEVGLFDEDFPCCEDYDLWLRVSSRHGFMLIDRPLTRKDGGRDDQLSRRYRVGMDSFRIKALRKCILSGVLSREQEGMALRELARKCRIYGEGCIKHGRSEEGGEYLKMPDEILKSMVEGR